MHQFLTLALATCASSSFVALAQNAPPAATEQRVTDAEREIQALWNSYYTVVRDDLPNTKGSVDCGTGRYEEIKPTNSYLVFFVACERIEPHLSGYRAAIVIGNPHAFGFTRVSGTLSYGENLAAALVKDTQRVPFSTATELRPGTWIRIEVPIAATDARDLTKIVVEFEAAGAVGRSGDSPVRSTTAPQLGLLHRP